MLSYKSDYFFDKNSTLRGTPLYPGFFVLFNIEDKSLIIKQECGYYLQPEKLKKKEKNDGFPQYPPGHHGANSRFT